MSARRQSLCTLIADDLTGACDAAVQFANLGYTTMVVLDRSLIEDCDAEVIAASTGSRNDPPGEAARKVECLAGLLSRRRSPLIFKKIDSTLRGNVAAEVDASMKAFACRAGVIAPAFPAMGRTVSDGWLQVERSASPPIHLPTLLKEQGLPGIAHADRDLISGGSGRLQERVAGWIDGGVRFIVFDSHCDADLETAIESCAGLRHALLWVGAAGLARALANHLSGAGIMPRTEPTPFDRLSAAKGSLVLCIGTDHPVTEEQLTVLSATRPVTVTRAEQTGLPGAERALREGRTLLVRMEPGKTDDDTIRKFLAGQNGSRIQGMLLSGGDTASLVCAALHAGFIRLNAEIADGVPWGWLGGGLQDGLPLATKSGGFGSAGTLVGVVDFLSSCPRA